MTDHSSAPGSEERDMRAALQHAVALVCVKEEMLDDSSQMSTQAVTALSELVYQYATTCLSNDLISFSRHANRRTITAEDVLLVARKDPQGLLVKLEAFAEREKLSSGRKENKGTATARPASSKKKKKKEKDGDAQLTQRMKELQQRLKKGIDSSDESDSDNSDVEMVENPRKQASSTTLPLSTLGKENQKQAATKVASDDDPFATSSEEDEARKKPAVVAEFPPGGTKSGFSTDSSSDDDMLAD